MKRLSLILALSFFAFSGIRAEVPQTKEGCLGGFKPYDFENIPALTPAPKGFKPVYVSTYARHGSRNYTRNNLFDKVLDILREEGSAGRLTETGKEFARRYELLYPYLKNQASDLTAMGIEQHRKHAELLYAQYPEIFRKKHLVNARATQLERTMMSMFAFCYRLKDLDPKVDITFNANGKDWLALDPNAELNTEMNPKYFNKAMQNAEWTKDFNMMRRKLYDPETFFGVFFTDKDIWKKLNTDPYKAETNMFRIITGSASHDIHLYDLVPLKEMQAFWECENFDMYNVCSTTPFFEMRNIAVGADLLEDIIDRAEEDLEGGKTAAQVRYGHDYKITVLLGLLDAEGWNKSVSDPWKVKDVYDCTRMTMAATLQFVFYQNRKGETLVKLLFNGGELDVPVEKYSGNYYRWDSLNSFCRQRIEWARKLLKED